MRLTRSSGSSPLAFLIATAVFLINIPALAQVVLPGNSSAETPLAPTTIIQDTVTPQLPAALEQEARAEIAGLRGIPNDTLHDYWSRGEIRAWMLLHALRVGYKQPSQYTPEEQQIASYFNLWIYQENGEIAQTAFALYNSFSQNPCGFTLPPGIGKDNGRDYLDEDGVTSFCNTPLPPPILGTFAYVPVPPASQFWSWAQTIVLNKHFHDRGTQLLSNYPGNYTPTSGVLDSVGVANGVTYYGPDSYTAAGAVQYVGALREMDEGTAFLRLLTFQK